MLNLFFAVLKWSQRPGSVLVVGFKNRKKEICQKWGLEVKQAILSATLFASLTGQKLFSSKVKHKAKDGLFSTRPHVILEKFFSISLNICLVLRQVPQRLDGLIKL